MAKQRGGNRLLFGTVGGLLVVGVIVAIILAAIGVFSKKGSSSGGTPVTSAGYMTLLDDKPEIA